MAYARNPQLRNWKKRCEIYTQRLELEKIREAALDAADEIEDDDEWDEAVDKIYEEHDGMIKYLRDLELSLESPETKNKWFCKIVEELGPGEHEISRRQAECFRKYFESDQETWRTHKSYCRAAGFFCTLLEWNSARYLKIEEIKKP